MDSQDRVRRDLGSQPAPLGLAPPTLPDNPFVPEQGVLLILAGGASWAWDGADEDGATLANGPYRVRLEAEDGRQEEKTVLLRHQGAGVAGLIAGPNPVRQARLQLRWDPQPGSAWIRLYTLHGGLAAQTHADGASGSLAWDLGQGARQPSGGIYILRFELRHGGAVWRQSLKLAVIQ